MSILGPSRSGPHSGYLSHSGLKPALVGSTGRAELVLVRARSGFRISVAVVSVGFPTARGQNDRVCLCSAEVEVRMVRINISTCSR